MARPRSAVHLIGAGSRRRTLLIVSDHEDTRLLLTVWLHRKSRLIVSAVDADAALEAIQAGCRPDVVVIDLAPGARGANALLEAMRREPDVADTPVVVVTGESAEVGARIAARCDVLRKPIDPHALKTLVDRLLDDVGVDEV